MYGLGEFVAPDFGSVEGRSSSLAFLRVKRLRMPVKKR